MAAVQAACRSSAASTWMAGGQPIVVAISSRLSARVAGTGGAPAGPCRGEVRTPDEQGSTHAGRAI
ncbi:hypothetical protein ACIBIZ_28910 [Nonomuraea spiralis]|uniref:hypothetical protein n=1 Tax=Nonomuraea spiralis TaxID=46182 RepID=UPI0037A729E3